MLLAERHHVLALYLARVDTQVAGQNVECGRTRLETGVLPHLEAAAALQAQQQYGMPAAGLAAGVGQHEFGIGALVEDHHVHPEIFLVPCPGLFDVRHADAYLLYSTNYRFHLN